MELALDTDEAMPASFDMAKDAEEAMSESSCTAPARGKERCSCSIDQEGEMEKLEHESRSVDSKGKMGHRSARNKAA